MDYGVDDFVQDIEQAHISSRYRDQDIVPTDAFTARDANTALDALYEERNAAPQFMENGRSSRLYPEVTTLLDYAVRAGQLRQERITVDIAEEDDDTLEYKVTFYRPLP